MTRAAALATFALWLLLGSASRAQAQARPAPALDARQSFAAGATAYSAGDFQAAIQAFEAAYAITPLPAIAFSLAQAERRQYLVTHEPAYLQRALVLFREYLSKVGSGGRRTDATDALAQLELLALAHSRAPGDEGVVALPSALKTRLLVRCQTPAAAIRVDGAAPAPSPVILEVTPGSHRIEVEARGFFPVAQDTVAVEGELIPVEVKLRERPALLLVDEAEGATLYIDGVSMGSQRKRLQLTGGAHRVVFAKKGHLLQSVALQIEPGETRHVSVALRTTDQRVAAVSLFAAGGATLAGGLLLSAMALHQESTAHAIDRKRQATSITPGERRRYEDALDERDRLRMAAIVGLAGAAAALVAGVLLYQLDDPAPEHSDAAAGRRLELAPGSDGMGLSVSLFGRM